jgi:hypothetical protein
MLTGPKRLPQRAQVELIGEIVGRRVPVEELTEIRLARSCPVHDLRTPWVSSSCWRPQARHGRVVEALTEQLKDPWQH